MLFTISTSGNSQNLINAVKTAKARQMITVGLLGSDGGQLLTMVEKALVVPHPSTQRVQEEHIFIIHNLVALIESDLIK
jgi:D-sedoheptulose 7-phosphate isomerase